MCAFKLPSVLSGNGFEFEGSYQQTTNLLKDEFNQAESSIILLFEKEDVISEGKWKQYIQETFSQINGIENLEGFITPFDQEGMIKKNVAYGILLFNEESESMSEKIEEIRALLRNESGLKVTITGEPVIVKDLNEASQKDLAKAEMIGLPIALLVLVLAFGSLVAASIPLLIGVISIIITMGLLYLFSYHLDFSIFILNIVPMIGLALSIDFALLFINRFKDEIKSKDVHDAICITLATAGRSVIFSGVCVFIGLLGLLFIKIDLFMNVAVGGMLVVLVSVISAITLLPSLLSILGAKVNTFSILKVQNNTNGMWKSFATFVMKKPIIMMLIAIIILTVSSLPVRDMKLDIPGIEALPTNYEARTAIETFNETFVDEQKQDDHKVIMIAEVVGGNVMEKEDLTKLENTINKMEAEGGGTLEIESLFTILEVDSADELLNVLAFQSNSPQVKQILDQYTTKDMMLFNLYFENKTKAKDWVRKEKEKENHQSQLKLYYGGTPTFEQEIFDEIYHKSPYGLTLILVTTFFILMFAFKSLLIPIKAIMMNMLSLIAAFGIIVWVFQQGHLGFEATDISLMVPVFVFSLVFGLSMDYEVFLISRIYENYQLTLDNDSATIDGLAATSKIITSAAAIMIVVTGAFGFTGVMPVKQVGVGIAIAIFIDASIIRMVLVPALMKLFGDWNWWFFGKKTKTKTPG